MALKGVDAFVKQSGKQHIIQVYRKRGKHYFKASIPPLNRLQDWRISGHVPPIKPYRDGYFIGRVIACRSKKTATVLYETGKWKPAQLRHTIWGYRQHTKAHIHDEYEICNPGDIVMFKHAFPHFSKIKKYGLVEVIRATPIWEDYPAWEGTTEGDFHLTHPSDPDRDDIESATQRAMKGAQEIKEKAREYKVNKRGSVRGRNDSNQNTLRLQNRNSDRGEIRSANMQCETCNKVMWFHETCKDREIFRVVPQVFQVSICHTASKQWKITQKGGQLDRSPRLNGKKRHSNYWSNH